GDGFPSEATRAEVFAPIAALEARSQHPLAAAIVEKAKEMGASYESLLVEDFQSITGKGLKGCVGSNCYYIGNVGLFTDVVNVAIPGEVLTEMARLQEQGKTVMLFGTDDQLLGMIAVADEVRASSRSAIRRIQELGIQKTLMLTGDNEKTAQAIGRKLGVTDIQANLLPEEKLYYIKRMGKEFGKIAMVGDGVNDAPALASATVGIAMGGAGTDTALETADIALMGDDLEKLAFTVELSRKALAIIKQNITFSIGIKLVALLLVVPGWLTLWIAIFADMGATILVTLNGLRLLKK
ncbi:MAG TPA: HAD-IC family P-type ATPase, partial [Pseudoneobacillus sp.]|nr:HAD-IC family P-type ATPase [Pseudoneobacillus sp.]